MPKNLRNIYRAIMIPTGEEQPVKEKWKMFWGLLGSLCGSVCGSIETEVK